MITLLRHYYGYAEMSFLDVACFLLPLMPLITTVIRHALMIF